MAEHPVIKEAWALYEKRPSRAKDGAPEPPAEPAAIAFRTRACYPIRVHFVGVWDTVGSLGIPRVFDRHWFPRFSNKYAFHGTNMCPNVRFGYHAVAIDEHRLPYSVTLWEKRTPN